MKRNIDPYDTFLFRSAARPKLGEVVNTRAASGTHIAPDLLAHVSPLGWEHINLTGEYRWPKSLA